MSLISIAYFVIGFDSRPCIRCEFCQVFSVSKKHLRYVVCWQQVFCIVSRISCYVVLCEVASWGEVSPALIHMSSSWAGFDYPPPRPYSWAHWDGMPHSSHHERLRYTDFFSLFSMILWLRSAGKLVAPDVAYDYWLAHVSHRLHCALPELVYRRCHNHHIVNLPFGAQFWIDCISISFQRWVMVLISIPDMLVLLACIPFNSLRTRRFCISSPPAPADQMCFFCFCSCYPLSITSVCSHLLWRAATGLLPPQALLPHSVHGGNISVMVQ